MQILDYIIIGCALASLIIGLIKGFLKPLVNLAGVFVVLYAGGAFASLLSPLLAGIIQSEGTLSIVSMIASMVLVLLIYFLISRIILKIIKKTKIFGALDRILGGVLGVALVYLVVSVVVAFMQNDAAIFAGIREKLGTAFAESWVVQNLFKTNPIGNGLVETAFRKLIEMFEGALGGSAA